METSSQTPEAAPEFTEPRRPQPPRSDPGFRIREDHIDGSVTVIADLGVSAGRLVDKISMHTRIGAVLAAVDADETAGRLTLRFERPQP
ncbi:hypothetical protein AB1484_29300 [Parafrankia sp. FMc6]|uniref:hypothetical protein n=1 Tax=Parafrankia soli TaxID=2599596 RepID=UPI0034D43401